MDPQIVSECFTSASIVYLPQNASIMGKSTRRKSTPQPRGRKTWVQGSKYTFLTSRGDLWRQAVDSNRAGEFYTRVTKLWLKKYPHSLPLEQDLEVDVEDPTDETLDDGFEDPILNQEEADEVNKKFKTLRQVWPSPFFVNKIPYQQLNVFRK